MVFSAFNTSVSGLKVQSDAIGNISTNIANLTVNGYKRIQSEAITEVSGDSGLAAGASGGGVRAANRQQIDQQGQIQGTGISSDLAISGSGFFVVNNKSTGDGDIGYTRAGSFRQDSLGNFRNVAGQFLMAWRLDGEGRLPGEIGNINATSNALLESLEPLNVNAISGTAAATSVVKVGMNLNAAQTVYRGAGDTITFNTGNPANLTNAASDIIIPGGVSSLTQGDMFSITSAGTTYNFTYGGFVTSKNIVSTPLLGAATPSQVFSGATAGDRFTISTGTTGAVSFTYTPSSPNTQEGQFNDLNSLATAINDTIGLTARVTNNQLYISSEDATEALNFQDIQGGFANHLGLIGTSVDVSQTNVLGANSATADFTGAVDNIDTFTVSTATGTITLTYRIPATPPNTAIGEFSNLTELASAINSLGVTNGVQATIVGNQIQVTTIGSNPQPITFQDQTGTFVQGLGLNGGIQAQVSRFNSLEGLKDLVNSSAGIAGTIENPLNDATLEIHAVDPLGTITFDALPSLGTSNDISATPAYTVATTAGTFTNGNGAIDGDGISITIGGTTYTFTSLELAPNASLGQFNSLDSLATAINTTAAADLSATIVGNQIVIAPVGDTVITNISDTGAGGSNFATTLGLTGSSSDFLTEFGIGRGPHGPAYDPNGTAAGNMASGSVVPQFSRNIRVYDALGTEHDFLMSFLKLANNLWATEIYAINPDDIISTRTDGQIASGTIRFNGDGSLRSIDTSLTSPLDVSWANGASTSTISLNFGTAGSPLGTEGADAFGLTDGLSQFKAENRVKFVNQNGVAAGLLRSLTFDEDGYAIANFTNGQSRKIFKIPLADFGNPNGLTEGSGNVFFETQESGSFNLREAKSGGVGSVVAGAIEASNVELSDELTSLIIHQQTFVSNSSVISTAKELLDNLNRITQ